MGESTVLFCGCLCLCTTSYVCACVRTCNIAYAFGADFLSGARCVCVCVISGGCSRAKHIYMVEWETIPRGPIHFHMMVGCKCTIRMCVCVCSRVLFLFTTLTRYILKVLIFSVFFLVRSSSVFELFYIRFIHTRCFRLPVSGALSAFWGYISINSQLPLVCSLFTNRRHTHPSSDGVRSVSLSLSRSSICLRADDVCIICR